MLPICSPSRHWIRPLRLATAFVLCAHVAANAAAPARADESTPTVDTGDLWRTVRHRPPPTDDDASAEHPFFTIAPTITAKPSTGLAAGASANVAFVDGDAATTAFSSAAASFRVTQRSQTLGTVRFGVFTSDDRWFVQGDTRLWRTSLGTSALGGGSATTGGVTLRYDLYRAYETTFHAIADHVFVGAGINLSDHTGIHAAAGSGAMLPQSAFLTYSDAHDFAADTQRSAGTNVALLFDSRDSPINASRGVFASATYRTFFDGFLGGQSTWQEVYVDARTYRRLTTDGRQRLAFWFIGDLVAGGTAPFLDLPYTSSDGRSARGYAEGRFRGPHLLYGEAEYRATLMPSGLIGAVAFVNTTTVDGDAGHALLTSFAPAAGGGLRVLLNKHSRTNFCADYGWGIQGSRGLYLGIQEAF